MSAVAASSITGTAPDVGGVAAGTAAVIALGLAPAGRPVVGVGHGHGH
jgi:hypothetical protein